MHRKFDDSFKTMAVDLSVVKGSDNLWAIPQSEIDINSKLVQNPGW